MQIDKPWYEICKANSQTLNCKMINATPPQTDENINFGAISSATNGLGLYQTSDLTKTEDTKSA